MDPKCNNKKNEKLLTLILLHEKTSDEFLDQMSHSINDWEDAWREMLYCILAGTQVSTDVVRRSYLDLIKTVPEILDINFIKEYPLQTKRKIEDTLKRNGYRFYITKSNTMINAANYFDEIVKDYETIEDLNCQEVRTRLIKNVKGIGNKISSHWLRNIGFQLPIIDIHVRRVLSCAGLIDEEFTKNQISNSEYFYLENKVIEIAKQLKIEVAKLDFILWEHGREYCIHNACEVCPLGNKNV